MLGTLIYHLVGEGEQRRRHGEAERLGGLEVTYTGREAPHSITSSTRRTDQRERIAPRSLQLSAEQSYTIRENLKDMRIEQVPRTNEIRIGDKVLPNIGLHDFPPFVIEKVPQIKTYKFFMTENRVVVVSQQNVIADIIK